jgi:hypothetical protein
MITIGPREHFGDSLHKTSSKQAADNNSPIEPDGFEGQA